MPKRSQSSTRDAPAAAASNPPPAPAGLRHCAACGGTMQVRHSRRAARLRVILRSRECQTCGQREYTIELTWPLMSPLLLRSEVIGKVMPLFDPAVEAGVAELNALLSTMRRSMAKRSPEPAVTADAPRTTARAASRRRAGRAAG